MAIRGVGRKDVAWQDADIAATYRQARLGIPFADAHFEIVHQIIRAHEVEVRCVLDLGAGDGMATDELLPHYPIERAVLIDFSEPMLDEARRALGKRPEDVRLVWGDLIDSRWREEVDALGPFDLAISRFAIHHLPDARKRSLYAEVLELLRPGGLFINIEHVASHSPVYERAFYRSIAEGIHRVEGGRRSVEEIEATYTHPEERAANILAPVEDQLAWLREIGFVDVDCLFKAFELAVLAGRKP
jgi:SAM-dependent methyltransferase